MFAGHFNSHSTNLNAVGDSSNNIRFYAKPTDTTTLRDELTVPIPCCIVAIRKFDVRETYLLDMLNRICFRPYRGDSHVGVTTYEALWDSGRLLPVRSIDGGLPDSIEASDLSVLTTRALLLCMFA